MMRRALVLAAAMFAAAPALASAYPTIVGSWYLPEYGTGDCHTHNGLHIEPMGLLTVETRCSFSDVARDGWRVTWHGSCSFSGDRVDGMTVVAVETDGTLSLDFGALGNASGFRRCP